MTDKEIVYKVKKIKKYQDLSAEHKKGANVATLCLMSAIVCIFSNGYTEDAFKTIIGNFLALGCTFTLPFSLRLLIDSLINKVNCDLKVEELKDSLSEAGIILNDSSKGSR